MSGSPDAARGPLHPKPAGTDNNARPAVGDRVRLVVEGTVADAPHYPGEGRALEVDGFEYYPFHSTVVSVEVLPPPEPEYLVGDVWTCNDHPSGGPLLLTSSGWVNARGVAPNFDLNGCDATLLVRDGKPVL